MKQIILASASPRRKELLTKITNNFLIIPSNAKEIYDSNLDKFKVSLYLSDVKALDIYKKHPEAIVIGVDTTVIINDEILGKPKDKNDAKRMLKLLSNKTHYVVTGVTIYSNDIKYEINSINEVYFKDLTDEEINEYLTHDEYKDKAGSYAIQGMANKFITKINGEFDSIVGLPTKELNELLTKLN